jgi:hypothetical protein
VTAYSGQSVSTPLAKRSSRSSLHLPAATAC